MGLGSGAGGGVVFPCPNVSRGFGRGKFDFSASVGTLIPESDEVFF